MEVNTISLMEAYLIEILRTNGVTSNKLEESVLKKDVVSWNKMHTNFDFQILIDLHEKDARAFRSIIHNGYQVKFITINGLKNLLKLKFDITEEMYELTEQGISKLIVDEGTLSSIKQMMSPNWKVQEKELGGKHEISITLNR
jgi:hypothetical protein